MNNAFVFPDPDPPIINILYGWSGIYAQSRLYFVLFSLENSQPDNDKIYLYAKDPYEAKYQYLINRRKSVSINHFNDPKAFIEYSNDM